MSVSFSNIYDIKNEKESGELNQTSPLAKQASRQNPATSASIQPLGTTFIQAPRISIQQPKATAQTLRGSTTQQPKTSKKFRPRKLKKKPGTLSGGKNSAFLRVQETLQKLMKDFYGISSLPKDIQEEISTSTSDKGQFDTYIRFLPTFSEDALEESMYQSIYQDIIEYFLCKKGDICPRRVCLYWQTPEGLCAFVLFFSQVNIPFETTSQIFSVIKGKDTKTILEEARTYDAPGQPGVKAAKAIELYKMLYARIDTLFLFSGNKEDSINPKRIFENNVSLIFPYSKIRHFPEMSFKKTKSILNNDMQRHIIAFLKWGNFELNYKQLFGSKFQSLLKQFELAANATNRDLSLIATSQRKLLLTLCEYRYLNQAIREDKKKTANQKESNQTSQASDSNKDTKHNKDTQYPEGSIAPDMKSGGNKVESSKKPIDVSIGLSPTENDIKESDEKNRKKIDKTREEFSQANAVSQNTNDKPILELNFNFIFSFLSAFYEGPSQLQHWLQKSFEQECGYLWQYFLEQIPIWKAKSKTKDPEGKKYEKVVMLTQFFIEKIKFGLRLMAKPERDMPLVLPQVVYQAILHSENPDKLIEMLDIPETEWMTFNHEVYARLWKDFLEQIPVWTGRSKSKWSGPNQDENNQLYETVARLAQALVERLKLIAKDEKTIPIIAAHILYRSLLAKNNPDQLKKVLTISESEWTMNPFVSKIIYHFKETIEKYSNPNASNTESRALHLLIAIIKLNLLKKNSEIIDSAFSMKAQLNQISSELELDEINHLEQKLRQFTDSKTRVSEEIKPNDVLKELNKYISLLPLNFILRFVKKINETQTLVIFLEEEKNTLIKESSVWEENLKNHIAKLKTPENRLLLLLSNYTLPGLIGNIFQGGSQFPVRYLANRKELLALKDYSKKKLAKYEYLKEIPDYFTEKNALAVPFSAGFSVGLLYSGPLSFWNMLWHGKFFAARYIWKDMLYNEYHAPKISQDLSQVVYPTKLHGLSENYYYMGTMMFFSSFESITQLSLDPLYSLFGGIFISNTFITMLSKILDRYLPDLAMEGGDFEPIIEIQEEGKGKEKENSELTDKSLIEKRKDQLKELKKGQRENALHQFSQLIYYIISGHIQGAINRAREERRTLEEHVRKAIEESPEDCALKTYSIPSFGTRFYKALLFSPKAPVRIGCLSSTEAFREESCDLKAGESLYPSNDCDSISFVPGVPEVRIIEEDSFQEWRERLDEQMASVFPTYRP